MHFVVSLCYSVSCILLFWSVLLVGCRRSLHWAVHLWTCHWNSHGIHSPKGCLVRCKPSLLQLPQSSLLRLERWTQSRCPPLSMLESHAGLIDRLEHLSRSLISASDRRWWLSIPGWTRQGCSMFERLYHHRFGNERSHNSRYDCATQDAAERIIRHSARAAQYGHRWRTNLLLWAMLPSCDNRICQTVWPARSYLQPACLHQSIFWRRASVYSDVALKFDTIDALKL